MQPLIETDLDGESPTNRVSRGRIPVPARVGALGALLSARPHGLGNASTGCGGI
jgi:hypothetical protein